MYLQALNDVFVILEPAQNIPLIDWSKITFNNVLIVTRSRNELASSE